jgi:hypothetical protein
MARITARLAVTAAATALAVTGLSSTALADTTPATTTAPSGSLVVQEDSTFLQNAANNGILAIALPNATVAYNSTTGFSATFPVTDGSANIGGFYGNIQLGGGLLLVNINNGSTLVFNNLSFDVSHWAITGVPLGQTTPVKLLDPVRTVFTTNAGTQTLQIGYLALDTQGAAFADTNLNTTFFTAHQKTGTGTVTFTPGS